MAQKFQLFIEEAGELAKAARKSAGIKAADGTAKLAIEDEAGDVLILLMDICNSLEVDVEQPFRNKETKNARRVWQ